MLLGLLLIGTAACDRALKVYAVTVAPPGATATGERITTGPPSLVLSDSAAGTWRDRSNGMAETVLWRDASVSRTV